MAMILCRPRFFCKKANVLIRHIKPYNYARFSENSEVGYCSLWEDCYKPRKQLTKKQRNLVFGKYEGHCAYCGCEITLKEMQADHIRSYYCGGSSEDLGNYNPACRDCNFYKSVYDLETFREWLLGAFKRWKRYKRDLTGRIVQKYGLTGEEKEIKFYFEKVKK